MSAKHTQGPWEARGANGKFRVTDWDVVNDNLSYYATVPVHRGGYVVAMVVDGDGDDDLLDANARLIAAAPELYEALKQTIALAWQDTREVKFDSTVLFGLGYDFDGWELFRSEIHTPAGSWAVWSSNGKYSAYGGPDGGMWFEKFDTSEAAEEAVLREIDRLCPSFPTAVARAALSKAAGEGV